MENLGFLENSRICKNEEERFPLGALYKGRNLVGVNPLEVQKKKKRRRVIGETNPAQIPMKPSNRWIRIASLKRGTWIRKNLMKAHLVYRNVRNATGIVQKMPYNQEW